MATDVANQMRFEYIIKYCSTITDIVVKYA